MPFVLSKTPHISLSCKLVAIRNMHMAYYPVQKYQLFDTKLYTKCKTLISCNDWLLWCSTESVRQVQISSEWNAGEDLIELIQMGLKFLKSQSVVQFTKFQHLFWDKIWCSSVWCFIANENKQDVCIFSQTSQLIEMTSTDNSEAEFHQKHHRTPYCVFIVGSYLCVCSQCSHFIFSLFQQL